MRSRMLFLCLVPPGGEAWSGPRGGRSLVGKPSSGRKGSDGQIFQLKEAWGLDAGSLEKGLLFLRPSDAQKRPSPRELQHWEEPCWVRLRKRLSLGLSLHA